MIESAIILTHGDKGYPHMEALRESNPDVFVHIAHSPETGESKEILWRNSDRFLSDWWRSNNGLVSGDVICIAEWDTLISIPIPRMPDGADVAARMCGARFLGRDGPRVRPEFTQWTITPPAELISFGFFLCKRWVMDAVCKSEWDSARLLDVRNEVRFPSIALAEGARFGNLHLPYVYCKKSIEVTKSGIYHPCKP